MTLEAIQTIREVPQVPLDQLEKSLLQPALIPALKAYLDQFRIDELPVDEVATDKYIFGRRLGCFSPRTDLTLAIPVRNQVIRGLPALRFCEATIVDLCEGPAGYYLLMQSKGQALTVNSIPGGYSVGQERVATNYQEMNRFFMGTITAR